MQKLIIPTLWISQLKLLWECLKNLPESGSYRQCQDWFCHVWSRSWTDWAQRTSCQAWKTSIFQHNLFRRSEGLLYGGGTLIFWPDRSWSSKLYPLLLYAFRWKIEISYYEQKTFWSFCDYMVRSRKGIETHIKSETMIKALKQLICQQVCHL